MISDLSINLNIHIDRSWILYLISIHVSMFLIYLIIGNVKHFFKLLINITRRYIIT